VGAAALGFSAIGSKHLTVLLPAWFALTAIGLLSLRPKWLCWACGALIAATTFASLFNYFTDRQFADADMVTPWRTISACVHDREKPGDALIVGYRPDRGAYDIFRRYYGGKFDPRLSLGALDVQYLNFSDWRAQLARDIRAGRTLWLLLHDSDPWQEVERWLGDRKIPFEMVPFQEREHTLQWLRAGLRDREKYRSPLYRLYRIGPPAGSEAAP
jgi:hypothetical protein